MLTLLVHFLPTLPDWNNRLRTPLFPDFLPYNNIFIHFQNAVKFRKLTTIAYVLKLPLSVKLMVYPNLKIHNSFNLIPSFRFIIHSTSTTHYNVVKFISFLLNHITLNEFTLKDTFDAVSAIQSIPQDLFNEGYHFVSFDVESLYRNVSRNGPLT